MSKWKLLLGSRKFWAAVVGLVLMSIKAWYPDFPLEEEPLTGIITLLMAYILGTAVEDGLSRTSLKSSPLQGPKESAEAQKK